MLPKHDLHLKLSKDKKTFTGTLSTWAVSVASRQRRLWTARILFVPPDTSQATDYQTPETYESRLALDSLLKTEGLPTRMGVAEAEQTYLSLLDVYAIRVTWDAPPLSSARRLSMQEIVGRSAPGLKHTASQEPAPKTPRIPPLAPVRRSSNARHHPATRPPVYASAVETPMVTSVADLWEASVVPEIPKGAWYGD